MSKGENDEFGGFGSCHENDRLSGCCQCSKNDGVSGCGQCGQNGGFGGCGQCDENDGFSGCSQCGKNDGFSGCGHCGQNGRLVVEVNIFKMAGLVVVNVMKMMEMSLLRYLSSPTMSYHCIVHASTTILTPIFAHPLYIRLKLFTKKSNAFQVDGQTDIRTSGHPDRRTDGQTDIQLHAC